MTYFVGELLKVPGRVTSARGGTGSQMVVKKVLKTPFKNTGTGKHQSPGNPGGNNKESGFVRASSINSSAREHRPSGCCPAWASAGRTR